MKNINLHDLILNTYDAVMQINNWQNILDMYTEGFGMVGCNIFCVDDIELDLNASFFSEKIERLIPKYIEDGIAQLEQGLCNSIRDINRPYIFEPEDKNISYVLKKGINTQTEIVKIESWVRDEGIASRGTILLNKCDNYHDWITLNSKDSDINLSDEDIRKMKLLTPHIAKVMEINRPFHLLQQRFNAVFNVLDRFKLGVVIVNSKRSIVLNNQSAERILEQGDCFTLSKNKVLSFSENKINKDIDNIISSFMSDETIPDIPRYHSIQRIVNDSHYFIETSRLDGSYFGDKNLFLIVIMDTSHKEIISIAGLVSIYKFTEAEREVSQLLVNGLSNQEIADKRNVSIETIRSQVKSIFQKTNTKKRSDLIRLAHSIHLPIDKEE